MLIYYINVCVYIYIINIFTDSTQNEPKYLAIVRRLYYHLVRIGCISSLNFVPDFVTHHCTGQRVKCIDIQN